MSRRRKPRPAPAAAPDVEPSAPNEAIGDAMSPAIPGRPPESSGALPDHGPPCALCGRPIPPGAPQSRHHLVPKAKGGKGGQTVLLHHLCHREVHATLSEADLARAYATPEALRGHPRLARFIDWVRRRPPGFSSRVPKRRSG